jgi:hypothetical protein
MLMMIMRRKRRIAKLILKTPQNINSILLLTFKLPNREIIPAE